MLAAAWQRLLRGELLLDDLWLVLPALLLLISLNFTVIRPHDFWWHVRTGQIIVETGSIPTVDLFSFTRAGQPWTNQAWLMQVLLYELYRLGGLPLVLLWHALVISGGYVAVQWACLRAGVGPRSAALATIAAAAVGMSNWAVRPQSVSFLLFGLTVAVLERHRLAGSKAIWALPALFLAWGNLHGGFVFGMGLLALYGLARAADDLRASRHLQPATRQALAVVGLVAMALCINPQGPLGLARYVLSFFQSNTTQKLNVEFMPLSARNVDGVLFFSITVLFTALALRQRATFSTYQALALLAFGAFSLYSRRVSAWFGLAALPVFAWLLSGVWATPGRPRLRRGFGILNCILLGLALCVALASLPWFRPYLPLPAARRSFVMTAETPIQATQVLCALGPEARVFNEMGYGSYLTWACPQVRVFVDTRIELYPGEMWRDYLAISNAQFGWEEKLREYGVNALFLARDQQETLIAAAKASGEWWVVYEDADTTLMVRGSPQAVMTVSPPR